MITKNYFKKRLSDMYDLSIIKYLSGEGNIEFNSKKISVNWELNLSVDSNINLVLFISGFVFTDDLKDDSIKVKFYGKTNDEKWNINSQNIKIGDVQKNVGDKDYTLLFCSLIKESLNLEKSNDKDQDIDKLEGYILNYDNYKNFEVEIEDRSIVFEQLKDRKEINKFVQNKRLDKAIFSTVNIPIKEGEKISKGRKILDKLCHLLSLINMNYNYCNLVKFYSNDEIVKMEINNHISMSFHRDVIIDNHCIRNGFKNFLEEHYEDFLDLNQNIDMTKFISIFSEIYAGNFIIEKKLAELIMAYEYLLTKYLLFTGDINKDDELSIQNKIRCLNDKHLRFIPSNLDGDDLRGEVRNNLFHLGHIPHMSFQEKLNTFDDYFDLLIRIILKMLGYTEKYISRHNFRSRDVV